MKDNDLSPWIGALFEAVPMEVCLGEDDHRHCVSAHPLAWEALIILPRCVLKALEVEPVSVCHHTPLGRQCVAIDEDARADRVEQPTHPALSALECGSDVAHFEPTAGAQQRRSVL